MISIDLEKIHSLTEMHAKRPVIVAYGIMNSGKSFMLNMLTGHISQELFKTNDIRETYEIKKFETEKYIYLDTPGLDANNLDDIQAQAGVSQADVVLFVHQPQGALEASEVKFLKNLKKSFGNYAESNIIIILSKIEKEDSWKIEQIASEIKKQCEIDIGFKPEIFQISSKRYQSGIINKQNGLVEKSHIKSLISHIDNIISNSRKVRTQRSLNEVDEILGKIKAEEQALLIRKKQIENDLSKAFSLPNTQINSLRDFITGSMKKYREI